MQLGARAGSGFIGPIGRSVVPSPKSGPRGVAMRPRPVGRSSGSVGAGAQSAEYRRALAAYVARQVAASSPAKLVPVTTAPPVPSPVPNAASLPEVPRRFPQPVQTSTRTRTVYAVKKMDRPSPAPGAVVVVEPEKKTNWLPLILAAGGAAFFLKG